MTQNKLEGVGLKILRYCNRGLCWVSLWKYLKKEESRFSSDCCHCSLNLEWGIFSLAPVFLLDVVNSLDFSESPRSNACWLIVLELDSDHSSVPFCSAVFTLPSLCDSWPG